ncbi:MAG: AraC family transcriptional regulator [Myxococcales bacterium]|nr:AraC family transcriptional regulator [Myxococcales bacterium]
MTSDRHAPPRDYAEFVPAGLSRFVECIWTRSASAPGHAHRILPDGCADFIFALGDAPEAFVVGPMTTAAVVPPRDGAMIGVRFRPGIAAALLRAPLSTLTDANVELTTWWPDAPRLVDALRSTDDVRARVDRVAARLRAALSRRAPIDRELEHAALRLAGADAPAIGELARELGRSRQHLARRFTAQIGLGPKVFARIMRLRRVLHGLRVDRPIDWAELAAQHGFADQAHLTHDFADLVGLPPTAWAGSISPRHPAAAGSTSGAP